MASSRTANVLALQGVRRGSVVALLLANLVETHMFIWGASAIATALPLNYLLAPVALAELIRASEADVLVTVGPQQDSTVWHKVLAIKAELGSALRQIIQIGGSVAADPVVIDYDEAVQRVPTDRLLGIEPQLDDLAALFHTGGTTGTPKLVQHTHRNHLCGAFAFAYRFRCSSSDVCNSGLPLFHVGGAICCALGHFMAGVHVVNLSPTGFRNPQVVANFWRLVERHRITTVGSVPTALGSLAAVSPGDANLYSVTKAFTGAAPMSRSVAERFEATCGQRVHEIYGMTETVALISTDPLYGDRVLGSAGFAVPFMEVEVRELLVDDRLGDPLPATKPGGLVVRGPAVTPGYRDHRHNTDAFTPDGWLITGDIGHIGNDGRITVSGRSKDIIIRSGHNIDPQLIEEVALTFPNVAAAAVGQPDRYSGEMPVCFVVPMPGKTLDTQALSQHLTANVAERPAVPKHVYVIDALPLTSVGKVFKPALRCEATRRLLLPLLLNLGVLDIRVSEDGSRAQLVRIDVTSDDQAKSLAPLLQEQLQAFLFRWELVVDAGLAI